MGLVPGLALGETRTAVPENLVGAVRLGPDAIAPHNRFKPELPVSDRRGPEEPVGVDASSTSRKRSGQLDTPGLDEGPGRGTRSDRGEDGDRGPTVPPARTETSSDALPNASGHGRRVVFSESRQRVWLVAADGDVRRTYPVSGSRYQDTLRPGRYEVYSKSRHAVSYDYKQTMDHMVRFTQGDNAAIGFHDLPQNPDGTLAQTRAELGTPLSSGCIRQRVADAKALWRFAPVGTPVVVVAT